MLGGPEAAAITALHNAGWSIGSDYAHGNAWGDPQSVTDYQNLITYMKTKLHAQKVVLLGASMGGLAALHLLRDGEADTAVLVSPVTNLPSMYSLAVAVPELDAIYGKHSPGSANPVVWSRHALQGTTITVIADPADPVVPFASNSKRFAQRFGATLLRCHGGHAVPACFAKVSFA
jgi:pimeloyl-ACP methyl ester carboxylesterase